jgi:hypothetical protein
LSNLEESQGGSDPTNANDRSAAPKLSLVQLGDFVFLKITLRERVLGGGVSVAPEGSRDLGSWRSGADIFEPLVTETVVLPGGEYREVSYLARETVGPQAAPYYFIRLRYELPPQ